MANYPHPILGNSDDYNSSSFFKLIPGTRERTDKKHPKGEGWLLINDLKYEINNKSLESLIKEKSAKIFCEITCPGLSSFSRSVELIEGAKFEVKQNELRGKVLLIPRIVATEDINDVVFKDTNSIFDGRKFQINVNDLLAQGDIKSFLHYPPFDEDMATEKESLIRFGPIDEDYVSYGTDSNGITIRIPKKIWASYNRNKRGKPSYINTLYCVPIIQNILRDHLNNKISQDWKATIQKDVEKYELTEESDNKDLFDVSQKIIERAISNASYINAAKEID